MEVLLLSLQNLISVSFICFICLFIFFIRPNNKWHSLALSEIGLPQKVIVILTLVITILISILPMPLSPYWNGSLKVFADKQQYDRMGDALLQGRLFIDNGDIDPALEAMENPYDPFERKKLGVKYHWDEAYYNHHYYMYFGVVPTIILFIPYKLLTGNALLTYQATQIFASLTIIGLFFLFYILCRKFFPKFPFSLYLLLSSAFSILSIGYSISAPALYCTAIVSGVCLMVWCIICYFKGAWLEANYEINKIYLFAGAFLGALAFGCRPPVGLANLIVIAVIYQVLNTDKHAVKEKRNIIALTLFPYMVVGVFLMLYNYARFDNVFEFGQSYQLTLADQHMYRSFAERFNLKETLIGLFANFNARSIMTSQFPYILHGGAFYNFPILLFSIRIFSPKIKESLRTNSLYVFSLVLFLIPIVVTLFTVYWSPFLLERYHLDFYYILCIVSFIAIASWLELISGNKQKIVICSIIILAFLVFVMSFLFFLLPIDGSYTFYYPEVLDEIYQGLRFGL